MMPTEQLSLNDLDRPSTSSDLVSTWFKRSSSQQISPSALFLQFRRKVSYMLKQEKMDFHLEDSRRWYIRYIGLILWSIVIAGLNFVYDLPGSLQNLIMLHFNLTVYLFSFIYAVYSWPNIVICVIGGFLIDRALGVKWALIIYTSIAVLGQILFTIGAYLDLYVVMLAGRFIFGSGCESSVVAINNYAALWFSENEINLVFSILMNMQRIGSALVYVAAQATYENLHETVTSIDSLFLTLVILGSTILIVLLCTFICAILRLSKSSEDELKEIIQNRVPSLLELLKFPLLFWLFAIVICFYMSVMLSFLAHVKGIITNTFDVSDKTVNYYLVFCSLFGAFVSACMGLLLDFKGKNMFFILPAILSGIGGFATIVFTPANPLLGMLFLSISLAVFVCSAWSPVAYIVHDYQVGTAYGIVESGMNLIFSVGAVAGGAIADYHSYRAMNVFFLVWIMAIIPILLWCWILDFRSTKVLNMSAQERKTFLKRRSQGDLDIP